jgi:SulP family sulfate permease
MTARTLRSSRFLFQFILIKYFGFHRVILIYCRWRSRTDQEILNLHAKNIVVLQLQGHIFFGNATILSEAIQNLLMESAGKTRNDSPKIKFLILDFTLVVAIDSSAAETISKIYSICKKFQVRICFSRGSPNGFPCNFPLSEKLLCSVQTECDEEFQEFRSLNRSIKYCSRCGAFPSSQNVEFNECKVCGKKIDKCDPHQRLFLSDNLDDSLAWCEEIIIELETKHTQIGEISTTREMRLDSVPIYLQQIFNVYGDAGSPDDIFRLIGYFVPEQVDEGTILWVQDSPSDKAILLVSGKLSSELEDEAGTIERLSPGHLVGEYGLLNRVVRHGTLKAIERCDLLVLHEQRFEEMKIRDPFLAFVLAKVCMGYLGHRVMHVANRIWFVFVFSLLLINITV